MVPMYPFLLAGVHGQKARWIIKEAEGLMKQRRTGRMGRGLLTQGDTSITAMAQSTWTNALQWWPAKAIQQQPGWIQRQATWKKSPVEAVISGNN